MIREKVHPSRATLAAHKGLRFIRDDILSEIRRAQMAWQEAYDVAFRDDLPCRVLVSHSEVLAEHHKRLDVVEAAIRLIEIEYFIPDTEA